MLLIFLILLLRIHSTISLMISGISKVRLVNGSNLFPQKRDGILEINHNGQWSAVCNFGFDYIAASVACFMLGFPPYGVPILNSVRKSSKSVGLSNFNCTSRILLSANLPQPSSVHLGICAFSTHVPSECKNHDRDVAIACLENAPIPSQIFTTISPSTFAPVTCPTKSESVRLLDGSAISGRLEVMHHGLKKWGTVCADGFGVNEARAVCRMLCTSLDDLAYAHPIIGEFYAAPEGRLANLVRVSCGPNAASLDNCSLVWGSQGSGCGHSMSVGIVCGPQIVSPPPPVYSPTLTCGDSSAVVRFSRAQHPDLKPSMVELNGTKPLGCIYSVKETREDVVVTLSLTTCGGSHELSNRSMLAVRIWLKLLPPSSDSYLFNPSSLFSITCLTKREARVQSGININLMKTLAPLNALREASVEIKLFHDLHFSSEIRQPMNILPGKVVYTLVKLTNPQTNSKLVLNSCWATSSPSSQSNETRIIIHNGCPSMEGTRLLPRSATEIGFSFTSFYFNSPSVRLHLFVVCKTRTCAREETSPECLHACSNGLAPKPTTVPPGV